MTGVVAPLPGWPPLITKKLPPRQAGTPWWFPVQPSTLASPNVPYTVWLPAGPLGAQLYGGAVTVAELAAEAAGSAPAASAAIPVNASAAHHAERHRNRRCLFIEVMVPPLSWPTIPRGPPPADARPPRMRVPGQGRP